jgi:Caudovirus prohead serine protease
MTHDFIINTENVNCYGYRILTDGIDYAQYMRNPVVLFMHEREMDKDDDGKGSAVIGRCLNLQKKGNDLVATIEFDEKDAFAKKIADKVAGGFIRMASIYAEVVEASSEAKLILQGQTLETVTKCKLVEISIVDIGGNDDALKLSKDGKPIKLNKVNLNKIENMSKLANIALALGIAAETPEDTVVGEVQKLKLAKEASDKKVIELQATIAEIIKKEAATLVEKVIALGLLPAVLKDSQIKAFENDPEGQKAMLSKLIADKEVQTQESQGHQSAVREVILKGKNNGSGVAEETYDYLQKFNAVKLAKIREEQPELYTKLAKEYANGVRHIEK